TTRTGWPGSVAATTLPLMLASSVMPFIFSRGKPPLPTSSQALSTPCVSCRCAGRLADSNGIVLVIHSSLFRKRYRVSGVCCHTSWQLFVLLNVSLYGWLTECLPKERQVLLLDDVGRERLNILYGVVLVCLPGHPSEVRRVVGYAFVLHPAEQLTTDCVHTLREWCGTLLCLRLDFFFLRIQ